jgi:multiple sugar transport system ATP-binding protein
MSLLGGKVVGEEVLVGDYAVAVPRVTTRRAGSDVVVGVRPEHWRMVNAMEDGLAVRVDAVEELGADAYVYGVHHSRGAQGDVVARVEPRRVVRGQTIRLAVDPGRAHLFDSQSGDRV